MPPCPANLTAAPTPEAPPDAAEIPSPLAGENAAASPSGGTVALALRRCRPSEFGIPGKDVTAPGVMRASHHSCSIPHCAGPPLRVPPRWLAGPPPGESTEHEMHGDVTAPRIPPAPPTPLVALSVLLKRALRRHQPTGPSAATALPYGSLHSPPTPDAECVVSWSLRVVLSSVTVPVYITVGDWAIVAPGRPAEDSA